MGFPVAVRTKDSSSDSMHIDSLETGLYLSNMIKSTYISIYTVMCFRPICMTVFSLYVHYTETK